MINEFQKLISTYDFKESEGVWNKVVYKRDNREFIINGQRANLENPQIKYEYIIEFLGDGWVSNIDDTNKIDIEWVKFTIKCNDEIIGDHREGFYDENQFKLTFTHFYK